ncbi:nucleoside diphosphate-linked moiety X motif 19-like [Gigantopelta aegis]|uniref:nucleoside diphosphate-linked moiety X motif 19-like n=1 Tax=Gigantopelta aegis TaxID=1735272 RepID=UPI001B887CE4|nr:nucleoside diphosphate-linked moiety X motif 19-like [Gigantopelta aegis]
MAAVLKNWREAATLILVTAKHTGKHNIRFTPPVTSSSAKSRGDNLEVLMLKRSSKSSFMPNAYVFPGGVADDADFSEEWHDVFRVVGKEKTSALFEFVRRGSPACPIFTRVRDSRFSTIPAEIALRICAIRETFEESGVLLVRQISDLKMMSSEASFGTRGPLWGSVCTDSTIIERWRREVDEDATKFVKMCKDLDVVPDVWSLLEWSNWLTPTTERQRRFDTAFFICCLPEEVHVAEDKGETVHSVWDTPLQLLYEYQMDKAKLWPPQVYTLSVLANFQHVYELRQVLFDRLPWRSERWMPVMATCDDGILMMLPGDDSYPEDPYVEGDGNDDLTFSGTMEEQTNNTRNHNRAHGYMTEGGKLKYRLFCNIDYGDRRLSPLRGEDLNTALKTQRPSNAKL